MWTEAWIADRWVPLDATLGQGGIGAAHLKFANSSMDGVSALAEFLPVIKAIKNAVSAEVVASGGAGKLEHFFEVIQVGATILLAASIFHFGIIEIQTLKEYLKRRGVEVRC